MLIWSQIISNIIKKNTGNPYKIQHLFAIIVLIVCMIIGLQWIFYKFFPTPYPNSEFYLLLGFYIIMLVVTAYASTIKNFVKLHLIIGFNKFKPKYILWAILAAIGIMLFDYIIQVQLLHIDMNKEAEQWHKDNMETNIVITFLTMAIFAPVIEEMLLRGIFLKTINNYVSVFWAVIIISLLFAAIHQSATQAISLFIASVIYIVLTINSKSIIPAIIAHIFNNAITLIYYLILTV